MSDQQASEAVYECPAFSLNANGWGPTTIPEQFEDLPFGLFNVDDNLGMIVDVTQPSIALKRGGLYSVGVS